MPQVKFDLSNKMGVLSYKIDSWAMFRLVQGNSFLFVLVFSPLIHKYSCTNRTRPEDLYDLTQL